MTINPLVLLLLIIVVCELFKLNQELLWQLLVLKAKFSFKHQEYKVVLNLKLFQNAVHLLKELVWLLWKQSEILKN